MVEVIRSATFAKWVDELKDRTARARVLVRIERLAMGNPGDVKPVGEGVSELRIDHGPGYRVYFAREGTVLIIILAGGDKSSQSRDIVTAKAILKTWKEQRP